ncbi:MAG: FAD-dependent monooxygenase [Candidatus Eremiobacteraeota bacterium]|nr:FAD-dependent monooxygenase [Candidatus Eremiobacteraeota bacterium]
MTEHQVMIVGAGPTGLMMAGELALAGVEAVIVERRTAEELASTRSGGLGLHSRTIEIFDQRGIADRFISQGRIAQVASFAGTPLDISDFPTRHNYGLALRQKHVERILAGWVDERSVPVYRGCEVTGLRLDDTGADIDLSDGSTLRAKYLIGCDGGRSVVRKAADIEFPGSDPTVSNLIAEIELSDEAEWGIRRDAIGTHALSKLEDGSVGVLLTEPQLRTGEPTLQELKEQLVSVFGTDFGARNPRFISRFTDVSRQAATYRKGRVLVAGDAAHIHPPDGGQGLNTGIQDAVNLAWKLAQVIRRTSPESLLDTYHAERHPVGARALRQAMAAIPFRRENDRIHALREMLSELLSMDGPRKRVAGVLSGLDIHYDLGEGHPLLGRRMPDLEVAAADGSLRVFTMLHEARPVLLNLGAQGTLDITPWADRVKRIDARYVGAWELPVLGAVNAPTAVLIRPDGHVAWVGDGSGRGLDDALTTWFGAPRAT